MDPERKVRSRARTTFPSRGHTLRAGLRSSVTLHRRSTASPRTNATRPDAPRFDCRPPTEGDRPRAGQDEFTPGGATSFDSSVVSFGVSRAARYQAQQCRFTPCSSLTIPAFVKAIPTFPRTPCDAPPPSARDTDPLASDRLGAPRISRSDELVRLIEGRPHIAAPEYIASGAERRDRRRLLR